MPTLVYLLLIASQETTGNKMGGFPMMGVVRPTPPRGGARTRVTVGNNIETTTSHDGDTSIKSLLVTKMRGIVQRFSIGEDLRFSVIFTILALLLRCIITACSLLAC